MRETFRRGQRLTSSSLFRETMDRGRVFRGRHFVLYCHASFSEEPARAGFFASKRVGGAVERNRAKRRLREAFRRTPARQQEDGVRMVFQARRDAVTAPFPEILAEMDLLLSRARMVCQRQRNMIKNA